MMRVPLPTVRRAVAVAALTALVSGSGFLSPPPAAALTRPERKLARLVNAYRHDHGVRRLDLSARMSRVADRHSERMAREGRQFDMTASELFSANCNQAGGVVAHGETVRRIHRLLVSDPPHRQIILRSYWTRMGVGIARGHGELWATEYFCS